MDVRLVTSFPEFERLYGGVIDTNISFLPFAVRGFFENGGRRAFVARAYSPDTGQAVLGTAAIGDLTLTAIGPGDWPQRVRIWVVIGCAHVCTLFTNAHLVFSLFLYYKNH